jgi:hypothetical protein
MAWAAFLGGNSYKCGYLENDRGWWLMALIMTTGFIDCCMTAAFLFFPFN